MPKSGLFSMKEQVWAERSLEPHKAGVVRGKQATLTNFYIPSSDNQLWISRLHQARHCLLWIKKGTIYVYVCYPFLGMIENYGIVDTMLS